MTRQAIREGAQLVLWPESSTPFLFEEDLAGGSRGPDARAAGTGADRLRQRSDRARPCRDRFFNSAFLVRADGTTGGVYRKMHLVPFGEYVPFQRLLFFAAPLTEQAGTFSPGLDPRAAAGRRPSHQRRHLLRSGLSRSGPPVRRRRQRAADDDHQRRVVRTDVGAGISISSRPRCGRSRTDVTWCDPPTPASAASSIRTAVCSRRRRSSRAPSSRRSPLPPDVDLLQPPRRRARVCVRRRDAGAVGRRQPPCKITACPPSTN